MNLTEQRYAPFALVREMMETPGIIRSFATKPLDGVLRSLRATNRLFLTGEGSSRIFPAKHIISQALKSGTPLTIQTQGCCQGAEARLSDYTLFGASNSGKTKELISLFKARPAAAQFGLTATAGAPIAELSEETFVLSCGPEAAVAATKSVVEQALFYHALLLAFGGQTLTHSTLRALADAAAATLQLPIDPAITRTIAEAPVIFFAGRNDGVAEEATLKTNEITRKKSAYLEGTYAVHGIEEVMDAREVVIVVDPFEAEEEKFQDVLVKGVGLTVIAVSARKTIFPTIQIPSVPGMDAYLQLLACWNVLIEVGTSLGINLDKPVRARKIGNEYTTERSNP